jgi:hypothetical protein
MSTRGQGVRRISRAEAPGGEKWVSRNGTMTAAGAQRLCVELMRHFSSPRPGVRVGELRVKGFNGEQIKSCFLRLRVNHILRVTTAVDVDGERFRGQIVGLTRLGMALLNSTFLNAPAIAAEVEDAHACIPDARATPAHAAKP